MMGYNEDETYPATVQEVPIIRVLRTYKAELSIFGEPTIEGGPWEKVAHLELTGSAGLIAAVIAWAGDAFKEDQER